MRHTGIPLYEPLIQNDLLIGGIILLGIFMLALLKQPRSLALTSLQGIFNDDHFFAKNATIGDHVKHYLLLILSIIGISLVITKHFSTYVTWSNLSTICLYICSFIAAKLLAMNFYFRLFFGKRSREFLYQYVSLIIIIGLFCYMGYVIMQFSPLIPPIIVIATIGVISICCNLLVFYILLKDFFNKSFLTFHFILYLCTLEILPILVVIKWAI